MNKRANLEMFGGDTEQFDAEEKAREELEALATQREAFIDKVVGFFYDSNARFVINKTARLYNAQDIAAFNIPVIEPQGVQECTPGFIPTLSNKELRKILKAANNGDVAFPVFADSKCKKNCLGFVICRGGHSNFEILDINAFGENEYSLDELYGLFKQAMFKAAWVSKMTNTDQEVKAEEVKALFGSEYFHKVREYSKAEKEFLDGIKV